LGGEVCPFKVWRARLLPKDVEIGSTVHLSKRPDRYATAEGRSYAKRRLRLKVIGIEKDGSLVVRRERYLKSMGLSFPKLLVSPKQVSLA
jgi:hypothetical protein